MRLAPIDRTIRTITLSCHRVTNLRSSLVVGLRLLCGLLALTSSSYALALDPNPPVITPDIKRDARIAPLIDSELFELYTYVGAYKLDGFRAEPVGGLRIVSHFSSNYFVEGSFATGKIKDRSIVKMGLPSVFEDDLMIYYNIAIGMNVLPGQIFFGKDRAITADFYLNTGVGQVVIDNNRNTSLHFGGGLRALPTDWLSLHMDVKSYFLRRSYLNPDESSHNIEYTFGIGLFF